MSSIDSSEKKNVIRCYGIEHNPDKDKPWFKEHLRRETTSFLRYWCPYSEPVEAYEYPDGRCVNWLRRCKITGKIVVHNKKCDAIEVLKKE